MQGSMEGKVALVTGGASGIGLAAANIFAREGAKVVIADLNESGGEAAAEAIRAAGGEAVFVRTDLMEEADIRNMVDTAVKTFGRLDAAFNNAGTASALVTAETCTLEEWDRVININQRAVWLCMRYEIAEMLKVGGGAIVNTASRAGDVATYNTFPYVASKHGVVGITRASAIDFAARNIRVNAICPGYTATPMLADAGGEEGLAALDAMAKTEVPMKRIGRPEEQAEVAVFLCSSRASYVTGHALPVDGGKCAIF